MDKASEEAMSGYVSMTEAARQLGVNRSAVYRIFPPERRVQFFGRWLVRREDLEAMPKRDRGRPRKERPDA